MNPSKWLFLVALIAGLAILGYINIAGTGDQTASGLTLDTESEDPTVVSDSKLLAQPPKEDSLESSVDIPQAATRTVAPGSERVVMVSIEVPEGAVVDPGLVVIVASKKDIGGGDGRARLAEIGSGLSTFDWRSSPVSTGGMAQVTFPKTMENPVLLLDGRYLLLDRPVRVQADVQEVVLRPKHYGCIELELVGLPLDISSGLIRLVGYESDGGLRTSQREGDLVQREFRGLQAELTWMVLVEMEEHASPGKMGIGIVAGETRSVKIQVEPGCWIEGRVRDEQGESLSNVQVQIPSPLPWMDYGGPGSKTETDEEGRYKLGPVRGGKKTVSAKKKGFVLQREHHVELASGEARSGIDLVMGPGLSVTGLVLWPDGSPAQRATVLAETQNSAQQTNPWNSSRRKVLGRTKTDSFGRFEFAGLEAGKLTLKANVKKKRESQTDAVYRGELGAIEAGVQGLEIHLEAPLLVRGLVRNDLGEPITEFRLSGRSTEKDGPFAMQTFKDEEGKFAFEKLGRGTWRLEAKADGLSQVDPIEIELPDAGDLVEITLARDTRVSGIVLDAVGLPVANGTVSASQGGQATWDFGFGNASSTDTDENGEFEFADLGPGSHSLTAEAVGWAGSVPEPVELVAGEERGGLVLTLRRGGRIVGTVEDAEGRPSVGHRVMWGVNSMGWTNSGETRTDGAGRFEFDTITPGEWMVTATASLEELGNRMRDARVPEDFSVMMSDMLTTSVLVEEGQTTEVHLRVGQVTPIQVVGKVLQGAESVSGAQVYAVAEGQAVMQGMKTTVSGVDGTYEITVDRPGAYILSATKETIGVETFVDIPQAGTFVHDLTIPSGSLGGRVRLPDGTPAVGIQMELERQDGLGNVRWAGANVATAVDGQYRFESLEPGVYTVRVNTASWTSLPNDAYATEAESGIRVGSEGETRQDFKLKKPGSIQGVVVDASGQPVEGVTLFVRDGAGRQISLISTTQTNASGEFTRTGLATGRYTVLAKSDALASTESESVEVRTGQTSTIRLRVVTGTIVVVTLQAKDKEDLERIKVEVYDPDGNEVGRMWTLKELMDVFAEGASTTTLRLGPFAPGTYKVSASTADGRSSKATVRLAPGASEKRLKLKL